MIEGLTETLGDDEHDIRTVRAMRTMSSKSNRVVDLKRPILEFNAV